MTMPGVTYETITEYLTIPTLARRYGMDRQTLRRYVDLLSPPVARVGHYRMVPVGRLPELERLLRERGYLRDTADVA